MLGMYFDLFVVGSPPSILVVNASSGVLKAIDEAKFEFYFEVISYPSPASVPRVSFNNSDLPEKWQTFYRSTEWTIISLSQVNYYYHFYVGLSVEKFLSEEDSGTYSLTVENMCNSLSTGVSIEGETMWCQLYSPKGHVPVEVKQFFVRTYRSVFRY